jgi:aminopeptidase-like protein
MELSGPAKVHFVRWGLKPKVLRWIYIMIIRPVLTYGSMVWWKRVNYNVSRMALNKIQRLACLAITGTMKITPTAAMGVLLGIPLLHVIIKTESQVGI